MLADNILNYMLFKYGYTGIDNIYEFWSKNNDAFCSYLRKHAPRIAKNHSLFDSFEEKARWRSHTGLLLVDEIRHRMSNITLNGLLPLDTLQAKYGRNYIGLADFNPGFLQDGLIDLRGISIIRAEISNKTLQNLDLSNVSFDESRFINVRFENCRFSSTSFKDTKFKKCSFDEKCVVENCDFRNADIDIHFEGPVGQIQISPIKWYHIRQLIWDFDSQWPNYTVIRDESLVDMSIFKTSNLQKQFILIKLTSTLNSNWFARINALPHLFFLLCKNNI